MAGSNLDKIFGGKPVIAAPAEAPAANHAIDYMDQLQEQAKERARLTINRYRDTTPDAAAEATRQSVQSPELLGQPVPPEAFFNEGELTKAFRRAEIERRTSTMNPRLSSWAAKEPVNAIMVREYGEELGFLGQSVEAIQNSANTAGDLLYSQLFGGAPLVRRLARVEEARADSQRTIGEIAADVNKPDTHEGESKFVAALKDATDLMRNVFDPSLRLRELASRTTASYGAESDTYVEDLRTKAVFALAKDMIAKEETESEYSRGIRVTRVDKRLAEIKADKSLDTWGRFGAQMGALASDPMDAAAWLGTVTLESAAPMAVGALATVVTKNPAIGAAVSGFGSGVVSYGAQYEQIAKDAGFDLRTKEGITAFVSSPQGREIVRDRAAAYGLVIGAMDTLSGGIAGKQLRASPMGELVAQGLTQAVMGSSGEALARLASDQTLDPFEIAIEGLAELVTVPVEVFGVGGQALSKRRRDIRATQDAQAFFTALGSHAEASEMKQKLPEKYRDAVAALTVNGPVETVHIDTAGLDKLFQGGSITPQDIAAATGLTPEAIAVAISEGTDLPIATADYAAKIAGGPMDKALREHMRINGSLTAAEVAAIADEESDLMKGLQDRITEVEASTKVLGETLETARATLVDELVTAGRAPSVAEAEATQLVVFAEVTAKRLGVSVEDFLADNPLPRVFSQTDGAALTEVKVDDLTTLRSTGGAEAAAIDAAARAAGLTEDATNDELAGALRAYTSTNVLDADGAATRVAARAALSNTLHQSSVPTMGDPLRVVPTGGKKGETLTVQDIARAFTDDVLAREGRRLDPLNNMDDRAQMIDDMLEELKHQLGDATDSGDQWYVEDVAAAMAVTEKFIPELVDNPTKRLLFLAVAALLSPQNNPVNNWEDAVQAFSGYLRTGELTDRRPGRRKLSVDELKKGVKPGPEGNQLVDAKYGVSSGTALPMLTFLIKQRGEEGALAWLLDEHTPRELAEFRRATGIFKDGDQTRKWQEYLPKDVSPTGKLEKGMTAFGPKVSDFMLNATGMDPTAVTVDLWLMRTFGRHRGTLLDAPDKLLAEGGIYDQPTRADREVLDIVITEIANRMGKSPSSVQALLWYYEQKLWRAHGAKADSRNFKQGAEVAAEKRGFYGDDNGTAGAGGSVQGDASRIERSGETASPDDLFGVLDEKFFGKSGWAVLTADKSELPDSIRVTRNRENEAQLVADLEKAGIPYRRVTGFYGSPEPEHSFVVLADEKTAAKLGQKYAQDSVLTRDGFVYTTTPRPNTLPTGTFLTGQAAIDTGFYSRDDSGRYFAIGMDMDTGPGVAVMPHGSVEVASRPQLPVRSKDRKVALYHWSSAKLTTVDPEKTGTGPLKNIVDRGVKQSFWGINPRDSLRAPGTGYVKEARLGSIVHMALVDPDKLYPWFEDPDGLRPTEGTAQQQDVVYRQAIQKAGYLGAYFTDDGTGRTPNGNVAVLYEAVPVEQSVEAMVGARMPYQEIAKHPDVVAAEAAMLAIPVTATEEQMGDADFRASRVYDFDGEAVVGVDAAAARLLVDAETLAWREQNKTPVPVEHDRKALIIMGPPAAGKSFTANRRAEMMRGAIIDSDEAKKVIPGYAGGLGANAVHEESSYIGKKVLASAIERGTNIVVPKVGDTAGSMEKLLKQLKDAGYEVHIELLDVSPDEAFRRMYGRFANTGRLIPAAFMESAAAKPAQVFPVLEEKGEFDGYRHEKSDAGRGHSQPGSAGDDWRGHNRAGNDPRRRPGKGRVPSKGNRRGGSADGSVELNQAPLSYVLADLEKASPGPVEGVRETATQYMIAAGLPVRHQASYATVDVARATEIARLYDEAVDAPQDPEVRAAYEALAKETIAQYQALTALGFTFEWIEGDDPYASPADAIRDMQENKHLWVFPTTSGFGTLSVASDQNPLLQLTGVNVGGRDTMVNDLFRIVHDVFGHGSEGASFGARGEENAWQAHVRMFSPLAARAMTAETRGQNSWVNFGPYAAQNKANPKDTVFADQKTTLLPAWVSEVGQIDDMPLDANGNPAPAAVIPEVNLPRGTELFQPVKPALAEYFTKDSKLKGLWYHSTSNDFETFKLVTHVGTLKAAEERVAGRRESGVPMTEGENIIPVYVNLKNPLDVGAEQTEDGDYWDNDADMFAQVVDVLDRKGRHALARTIARNVEAVIGLHIPAGGVPVAFSNIVELLEEEGYDGIQYTNRYEDAGQTSYVVFRPNQLKSPWAQFFDPEEPAMLAQGKRGSIILPPPGSGRAPIINLFQTADLSTVLHESGHYFLWTYQRMIQAGTAPAEIVADYEALKAWWGKNAEQVAKDAGGPVTAKLVQLYLKKGTTGDATADAAIYVGMQELFARAYEGYLFEGKSPSTALSRLFDTFSSWMLAVYRKVSRINVPMDEQVRGVFDRMLATDEELAKAKATEGRAELISKTAAELGISDEEYAELVKLSHEAQDDARRELLAEIMAPMLAQARAEHSARKAAITDKVQAEVQRKPVHRVIQWLGNGRWLGGDSPDQMPAELRMDRQMLIDRYGAGIIAELPKGKFPLWKAGSGVSPDEVAMWFGFASGDAMVQALKSAPALDAEVKAAVDEELRKSAGDPMVDGSLPAKALDALNGEMRGKLIAMELKVLGRRANKRIPRTTLSAAREAARRKISLLPIRQAIQFDAYRQSAARAATRAQQALALGDFDLAYEEKRKEMLNHALYMEARDAAREVEKLERKVARLKKPGTRKNIDGVYLSAIDEVLDRYDFRRITASSERRRGALKAYVEMMLAAGRGNELAIPQSVLDEAKRRPYKTLPYNELRGIADTLANIEHTGRRKKTLLDAKRQRDLDTAVADVVAEASQHIKGKPPARTGEGESTIGRTFRHYLNLLLNADTLLREMDGWSLGKAYDLIKTPIDEAGNVAQEMRVAASTRMEAIYSTRYDKAAMKDMAVTKDHSALKTRNDKAAQFSKWELISMALNMGNSDNLARLMDKDNGYGYTLPQVDYIKAQLSDKDWDFVESVWAHIDEYWPLIAEREQRQTGVVPTKVEAVAFELPSGRQIKGGYYPIRYDSRLKAVTSSEQIAELQMNMMLGKFGKAQTRNGHTKERTGGSGGRVLQLGMSVYHEHIASVIHDLAFSEAVNNSWRVLQHPDMVAFFESNGRSPDREALELWVQDVATGTQVAGGVLGSLAIKVKSTFTLSKLAFNLSTVAIQMTGVAQSMVVVGKVPFGKAMVEYASNRDRWLAVIKDQSAFMRERETTFHRDIFDMQGDTLRAPMDGPVKRMQHLIGTVGFWLMTKVQYYGVDIPTWIAGYNNALADGKTHDQAVHHADRMVARAQASGLQADRSAFERGTLSANSRQSGLVRLFTALGSYMFAKGNIAYERVRRGGGEIDGFNRKSLVAALSTAFDLSLLFTLEALLYNTIKGTLPGMGDDDDDKDTKAEWAKFLARETAMSIMSTMPVIRDVSSALGGFTQGGAYGSVMDAIFVRPAAQLEQGELDLPLVKALSGAIGAVTGLPSAQANRLIEGLWRMHEGEDVAPMEFIMGKRY